MKSLRFIFERLGLNKENGLFIFSEANWKGKGIFPQKIEYALGKIQPDAFYCFNNEPLVLFFEDPQDEKKIHEQCWNFNKAPVIFVNTKSGLKIYNGFSFDKRSGFLNKLADENEWEQFSYWRIVSGQLWIEYEREFSKQNRLDYKLLENIEAARDILIKEQNLNSSIANKLIGRLIFTRYLIDRNIRIGYHNNNGLLSSQEFLDLIRDRDALYDFFDFLNTKFKGDLFPLNGEKDDVSHENLEVLYRLFKGDEIGTGQLSLFSIYNFDIIPIEFVSNIYEYFIGKDKQERNKSFYTPPFLVDYILRQTVVPHLDRANNPLSCRVLDPACGSGIFLVETLRLIILRFKELNPHLKPSQHEFKQAINRLLVDNIYGIDKDKEAIEIAIFSLYITLLDFFEEPKDINGFEFPCLMETNFIEADFFVGRGNDQINPDFIVGNPPWGKVDSPYLEYIKGREKIEGQEIKVSNKQIAQAFMVRVSDFCNSHTKCSLIVTSKILYNLQANQFRKYFMRNFFIDEVLEISSVRKQIFVRAVGPAAIITFRYAFGHNTDDNRVEHISLKPNPLFSLFKTILIEKYDYKEIKQSIFKEYDWCWKVLVYGSVLDFYFIKKLMNRRYYQDSIGTIIEDSDNELISGEGIQIGGGDQNDASDLVGMQFVDTKKTARDLSRYHISVREESRWKHSPVHRRRNKDLFLAPLLLIKGSPHPDFSIVAGICEKNIIFTDSAFAIKSTTGKKILEHLLGIINSNLMTYFFFMTGSSAGIEREQVFKEELFQFPVIIHDKIAGKVQRLLELHKKAYGQDDDEFKLGGYKGEIGKAESELNEVINDLYKLTDTERDLMNYAFEVCIPILQGKSSQVPFSPTTEEALKRYASLYVEHFSNFHNSKQNGYVQVDIYQTLHIVGMNFKIVSHKPGEIFVWKKDIESEKVIEKVAGMAFQKLSNKLFIQKDIKGINKDSFYVIKPNQHKYWHPAVARLDIIEFENSMMESHLNRGSYGQD